MRIIKACVRCKGAFLATENMLVCERCYGSPDDHEMARMVRHAEMIHTPTDAYQDVINSIFGKIKSSVLSGGSRGI